MTCVDCGRRLVWFQAYQVVGGKSVVAPLCEVHYRRRTRRSLPWWLPWVALAVSVFTLYLVVRGCS